MSRRDSKGMTKDTLSRPLGDDACEVPPAMPAVALPELMFDRDHVAEKAIRDYVEWQAPDEKVEHAERLTTEFALGRRFEAWDVHTNESRWWVITSPTNLYSQALFPSLDYTISFHIGLTARVLSKPDRGVPDAEQAQFAAAWRIWEQASESLEEADEAEEFQSVGMRCRECLVALVKAAASADMVSEGEPPKRSNFVGWTEIIANHIARGESAQHVRGYLKSVASSGWQLVNWLTHASGASYSDAALAVEVTQHVVGTFGTALFRHSRGIPDRCQNCGSYRIGLWSTDGDDVRAVPRCRSCGTECPPVTDGPQVASE